MSSLTFSEAFGPHMIEYKAKIMEQTWGHLAPRKNKKYKGRIVYAYGCYGLDPTPLFCEFDDLEDSPWFYEAMMNFLRTNKGEVGNVYEFTGVFRNYVFSGQITQVFNS